MAQLVYLLCAFTSLTCAVLLARAYRANPVRLLFWSAVCFAALTTTNVLLFLDRIVFPEVSFMPIRNAVTLLGMGALLYGLIFEKA